MFMYVRQDDVSAEEEEVNIPLWQIKIVKAVKDKPDVYKFKKDDTWSWFYVDGQTADKICEYIYNKEGADQR